MQKNKILTLIGTVSMLLSFTACGFHLRGLSGSYKFPFKQVNVQCNNVVICPNIATAIKNQDLAIISPATESTTVIIKLSNEQTSRDPQSFNSAGRIAAYLLTYQVTASLWQNNEQISNDMLVSAQLIMQYNDSTILSNNLQEANFWEQLHQNVTNQLIRRIVYFKPGSYAVKEL